MNTKWIYLLILALIVLLIGLWTTTWSLGSVNESQGQEIDQKQELLEKAKEKLQKQDKKIKQLNKQLQSKKASETLARASQTSPKPILAAVAVKSSCQQYKPIFAKYDWNVSSALALCSIESGGNPYAANWTDNHGVCMGSFGLMQISCHSGQVYNPEQNIAIAYAKYKTSGWSPWPPCYNGLVRCV
jgi:2-oxoglutarate dehydrogenase complex dehydrogenase (E1) component-like enzyme